MLLRSSISGLILALSTLVACSGSEHQIGDRSGAGSGGVAGSPGSGGNIQDDKGGTSGGGTSSGGAVAKGGSSGAGGRGGASGSGGTSGNGGHAGSTGGSGGGELSNLARGCIENGGQLRPINETYPPGTPYCSVDIQDTCQPRETCIASNACECPTGQCFAIRATLNTVWGGCVNKPKD
jgi:hypothetical protein